MPTCEKCGKEVHKVELDRQTGQKMCIKCLSEAPFYPLEDSEIDFDDERRAHVRIPIALGMAFTIGHHEKRMISYPVVGINLSTGGLCFAWKECEPCTGYMENGVDKKCLFFPYSTENKKAISLDLKLQLTTTYQVDTKALVVHIVKEENTGFEYVGCKFLDLPHKTKYIIEQVMMKYGAEENNQ